MIQFATRTDAQHVIQEWGGVPESAQHLSDSGSSVFQFRNRENELQILRMTDATFRTRDQVQAELEFLAHLEKNDVPIAAGVHNQHNSFTSEFTTQNANFICSVVAYADGIFVNEQSPHWQPEFFRAWGRTLALIHCAAETYEPAPSSPNLWQWDEENLFRMADALIPKKDVVTRERMTEIFSACYKLPRSRETFGLIHADLGPQNFHYNAATQKIIAFDFGNACYHWFGYDVAIAVSTLRLKANRAEIKRELFAGYGQVRTMALDSDDLLTLFLRLRVVYVYLARLYAFGATPTAAQAELLKELSSRIHARTSW